MEVVIRPASRRATSTTVRALFDEYARGDRASTSASRASREERDGLPGAYAPPRGRLLLAESDGSDRRLRRPASARGRAYGRDEAALPPSGRAGDGARPPARARPHRGGPDGAATSACASTPCPRWAPPSRCTAHSGFREIPAYRHNPVPGALFLELHAAAAGREGHEDPHHPGRRLHEPGLSRQSRPPSARSRAGSTTARCSRSRPRTTSPRPPSSSAATAATRSAG